MEIATVNGVELEYEVVGSGEPVLLISPVLADGFLPLIAEPELADRYQLIRYHKRGWVGSTHTVGPVSVVDHATDAAALLDHLGVQRAHVAGHSSGGAVAAQLALDAPRDRRRRSILLELSLLSVPSAEAFFEQAGPAFEAYGSGDHESRAGHLHERRRRRRLGHVPSAARRASPRRRGPGHQGRGHLLRSRAARPHRVGVRRRAGSRHPPARAVGAGHRHPAACGWRRRVPPLRRSHRSRSARSMASAISCTSSAPSPSPEP